MCYLLHHHTEMKLLGIISVDFSVTDRPLTILHSEDTGSRKWECNVTVHQLFMEFYLT
jgi:hypothetical protein